MSFLSRGHPRLQNHPVPYRKKNMTDHDFKNKAIFTGAFIGTLAFCTWATLVLGNLLNSLLM